MKTCARFGELKVDDEFNWRYFGLSRQSICRDCQKLSRREHYERHSEEEKARTYEITKRRREEAQRFIYEYLSEQVCAVAPHKSVERVEKRRVLWQSCVCNPREANGPSNPSMPEHVLPRKG